MRNTRGGRPLSVIPASRKGYSLALEVSGKAINLTASSTVIFSMQRCNRHSSTAFRPVLPALLWSSLTAPKFRKFLNKASYDPSKLSNGHGVLVLLFAVCYIVPWVHSSAQPFSLYLISGIDVTKEDRRHLNTMQLKTPRSSCPMVEEPKKQKWFGFKRTPLAGLVERKA